MHNYLILYLLSFAILFANEDYVQDLPSQGDGIHSLLKKYYISPTDDNIDIFIRINEGKFSNNNGLILNRAYNLPIQRYQFNGRTIRSSIDNYNFDFAKRIEIYNDNLYEFGLKPEDFRIDKDLWVPLVEHNTLLDEEGEVNETNEKIITTTQQNNSKKEIIEPLFGEKYSKVKIKSNDLDGYVFHLVSGHGGPDPGAIGHKAGYDLHEDEYAYDITLRLARNLMEHSAKVYMIVQDEKDGIRDGSYLDNSKREKYIDGSEIPLNQLARLRKRAELVNKYHSENIKSAKNQIAIVIHVDSRSYGKRLDIFFYHHENSSEGKELSNHIKETIRQKYAIAQPGRGYEGTVSHRNLYMLRKTNPVTCFIELGNIRNTEDQIRFLKKNNRQAIANWLFDGLYSFVKK